MRSSRSRTLVGLVTAAAAASAFGIGAGQASAADGVGKGAAGKDGVSAIVVADAAEPPDEEALGGRGVEPQPGQLAALTTIQSRIADYVARNGTRYTFGTYEDPETGAIVIDTDAPSAVVNQVTGVRTDRTLKGLQVQTRQGRIADAWHRRDDVPAFYGGGGLSAGGGLCSTGYAVQNGVGTRFMVTAGHCYANGTVVRNESGSQVVGTVTGRALASLGSGAVDMELLQGSSYAGRVFTGGVVSTSSIPVVSAGSATVGYSDYCHSGRTTGEQCGHRATSVNAQVCTQTGCKSPVIAYVGGVIQQGGDSGGAFYAKDSRGAFIRGHVIASSSTTGYVERWDKVQSRYGVSIVTG
ncbi:chymotrypsin family serine protease [Motilibacter aurantiacus]|uniref:hypothetical protein n=1 Tax=Motilibacter aurantiacus TaxID=2714955 RepID=UPI0014096862|nr:hypothetical protein [Motilibacter aurantiacus]NHC46997.1 hypothetical protein [Motilibacter aurantiacus]